VNPVYKQIEQTSHDIGADVWATEVRRQHWVDLAHGVRPLPA